MIKPGFDVKGLATGAIALFVAIVMLPSVMGALQSEAVAVAPRLYTLLGAIGLCAIPIGLIVHHSPKHKTLGQELVIAGLIGVIASFGGVGVPTSIGHFAAALLQGAAGKL